MAEPLKLALAGLGTVGVGVLDLLQQNRALIEARAGRSVEVVAVSARDRSRDRGVDLSPYRWCGDPRELAEVEHADIVVELVGGSDGPALELARGALASGKGLVTANKAMIAHHGMELAASAEQGGLPLKFEAAVAGGIPVVKGLREGAAANAITRIYGILNGTCNYILSEMETTGANFADVLAEAQAKGFAEADPTFDIEGVDAAHKLAILAAIGFGAQLDFDGVACEGISRIQSADIEQARALGYVIRLLGIADLDQVDGHADRLLQRVRPCLVPRGHPLAHVDGATNAVVAEGNFSGRLLFQGAGAGAGPTASAVVADIVEIARGDTGAPFSVPSARLQAMERAELGARTGRSYMRFTVADRPGVLAEIAAAMRDAGVSIESLIQPAHPLENGGADGGEALIAMVAHKGREADAAKALKQLEGSDSLTAKPLFMPILSN
ncbi:MAG: homoserine dehydrogenase [Alteripontixanthobacter sp.]